jgi:hypothetical protein
MKWEEWESAASNEALWQNREEKGLVKAEYLHDFLLRLWFDEEGGVSVYELDFYPLLFEENPGEVFLPLRDVERFRLVKGEYALIWLNQETDVYDEQAVDIAPECIRFFCERYGKKLTATEQERYAVH